MFNIYKSDCDSNRFFLCMTGIAYVWLIKVQLRFFTNKCSEVQVVNGDVIDEGNDVVTSLLYFCFAINMNLS